MTKPTTSLPLTIALQIPTYWTAEQAFAEYMGERRDVDYEDGRSGYSGNQDNFLSSDISYTYFELDHEKYVIIDGRVLEPGEGERDGLQRWERMHADRYVRRGNVHRQQSRHMHGERPMSCGRCL